MGDARAKIDANRVLKLGSPATIGVDLDARFDELPTVEIDRLGLRAQVKECEGGYLVAALGDCPGVYSLSLLGTIGRRDCVVELGELRVLGNGDLALVIEEAINEVTYQRGRLWERMQTPS